MKILVFPTLEDLSRKAAEIFIETSRICISSKRKFTVAVSGGSTPGRLYALLSSDLYRDKIDWSHTYFFWVDERCVPKEHEDSNYRLVFETLLSKLPIPDDNIHRIKSEKKPEKAAKAYEEDLKNFFGKSILPVFDLTLLGIGQDGHTASLFPNSKALMETKLAVPVFIEKSQKQRITLTLPVLNNSFHIVMLASGSSKADILYEILCKKEDTRTKYPAGLVRPVKGTILWLLDEEAAKKIKNQNNIFLVR